MHDVVFFPCKMVDNGDLTMQQLGFTMKIGISLQKMMI